MTQPKDSHLGATVHLDDRERAVVRNALEHYLDDLAEDDPAYERLQAHHGSTVEHGRISVEAGMADTYQVVFREYAQELQRRVEMDDEAAEVMAEFFRGSFTSVIDKIRDATGR